VTSKKPPQGRPPKEPVSLSGRTVAGRYRIVGLLGQGGIGKVYEAEQIGLDRQVAVKVIRPERRSDAVTTQRFLREARAAGRITSPHVVTLFDCGTDDETGELYIAMEMLHGQSLAERLASSDSMAVEEAMETAAAIARGLRAAHEAGVLHRDLKPANVFLSDDGTVKVLDFGIAKLIDDRLPPSDSLTQENRVLGTPMYMSPEAATRRPLGPTADLYALGILIYEMLVGAPPFKTGNAWRTLEAQVKKRPPRLTEAAPWRPIPKALDDLVETLLRKSPLERPRDAGEVAETLDGMAQQLRAREAQLESRTEIDVRLPQRRKRVVDELAPPITSDHHVEAPSGADLSLDATKLYGAAPKPLGIPATLGRPFPKEALEAYRAGLSQPEMAPESSRPRALSLIALTLALGALAFIVALALRLLL